MIGLTKDLLARELKAMRREVEAYPDDDAPWILLPGWTNSGGTLALHVAGNLQHYIGAVLGESGYVRDRDSEFTRRGIPRTELTAELDRAADAVGRTLDGLDPATLDHAYPLPVAGHSSVTTGGMLTHLLTHTAYHLGQIDYHRRAVTGEAGGVSAVALGELARSEAPGPLE